MSEKTLEQLDEEIESIKERLAAQIQEIVDIIVNDLPNYALKNIRRAFIEDVQFAEKMTDAELGEFKARIESFGRELSEGTRSALLEDMDKWWGKGVSLESAGKTLDGNPSIAPILAGIGEKISEFIRHEGLSAVEIQYKTPARFIDGKYPPGMIEKYWAQLANLRSAEEQRAELDMEARKARLAQRWDSL